MPHVSVNIQDFKKIVPRVCPGIDVQRFICVPRRFGRCGDEERIVVCYKDVVGDVVIPIAVRLDAGRFHADLLGNLFNDGSQREIAIGDVHRDDPIDIHVAHINFEGLDRQ